MLDELAGYLRTPIDPQWHTLFSLALGGAAMLGHGGAQAECGLVAAVAARLPRRRQRHGHGPAVVPRRSPAGRSTPSCAATAGCRSTPAGAPFFLGLILGEFAVAALWMAIDAAAGITDHRVFP